MLFLILLKLPVQMMNMLLEFYIKFSSVFGQSVFLKFSSPIDGNEEQLLQYQDKNHWRGTLTLDKSLTHGKLTASIVIREEGKEDLTGNHLNLNLNKIKSDRVKIYADWNEPLWEKNIFNTKAFRFLASDVKDKNPRPVSRKKSTHFFVVKAPHLPPGKVVCLTGSDKALGSWEKDSPLLMQFNKKTWKAKLQIKKDEPVLYKLAIYDKHTQKIIRYETGENRRLPLDENKSSTIFIHENISLENFWKHAGLNVPVSALRSRRSWGIGDFSDLLPMVDWASASGIKILQLLPVNDTTATHTFRDAYPYAAISAFALHPLFLDVQKLARAANLRLPAVLLEKVLIINASPTLDYEAALSCKLEAIELLFEKEKYNFKDDLAWFEFLDINRHWLVPYAAFCYLRDVYESADFSQWEDYSVFDEDMIQELVSPESDHYDKIALHYYTQFHLHLQLTDAVDYAHKKHIAIKGDLPIGVHTHSVDTWMSPHLFHMHMQAGAPPDAFTQKGQNWSFPTYNWTSMESEGFSWWRQRMEHLSNYFDAIRIDHILGFFRIWSIPRHAREGILGKFVPANPYNVYAFEEAGINFQEEKFCNPLINDQVLLDYFGEEAEWIKKNCLVKNCLNKKCNTQENAALFLEQEHPGKIHLLAGLLELIAQVILLKDELLPAHYHFRINMQQTAAFKNLNVEEQQKLEKLYLDYFYRNQDSLWETEGIKKLEVLTGSSDMFICGEDLGMVPEMVPQVLKNMHITGLVVQRMPQKHTQRFAQLDSISYLTVVTPSTHDMSPIRLWWQEDRESVQIFYNEVLGKEGEAPAEIDAATCTEIITQHLQSPGIWAVFLLQDLLALQDELKRKNPAEERINNPADAHHYWNYRMHLTLEDLLGNKNFSKKLRTLISENGR